jgi:hypothetical protein
MKLMDGLKRILIVATSCALALSLIFVASCAPLCAGAACLTQSSNTQREARCHGIAGHDGASIFVQAQVALCALGETGVAILGKTSSAVTALSPSAEKISKDNAIPNFVASASETPLFDGSPGSSTPHDTKVVLRT